MAASFPRIPREGCAEHRECHGLTQIARLVPSGRTGVFKAVSLPAHLGAGKRRGLVLISTQGSSCLWVTQFSFMSLQRRQQHLLGCSTRRGVGMAYGCGSPEVCQGLSLSSSCPNLRLAMNSHLHVIPNTSPLCRHLPVGRDGTPRCALQTSSPPVSSPPVSSPPLRPFYLEHPPPAEHQHRFLPGHALYPVPHKDFGCFSHRSHLSQLEAQAAHARL